jgi:hypothetical protein
MIDLVKLPSVRKCGFFLRLNIMKDGIPAGTTVDKSLPVLRLDKSQTTIGEFIDLARNEAKKLVLIFGSITW